MKQMYILVGATTTLDKKGIDFYIGTAINHFDKENRSFRKAKKKADKAVWAFRLVNGGTYPNVDDYTTKVQSEFWEWQPDLREFHFNKNHFHVGGIGVRKSTGQEFKWVVIMHFE